MTSHGIDAAAQAGPPPPDVPHSGTLGKIQSGITAVNGLMAVFSAIAIGAAGCVLTWEVAGRYFLHIPSDWQDELSAMLLIGATFGSAAWTQARRGHVAIDALAQILPPAIDRIRRRLADLCACAFCAYFAWKSWTLLEEAWTDNYHSGSTWGPPLWIPYSLMAVGMTLLSIQLLLQVIGYFRRPDTAAPGAVV